MAKKKTKVVDTTPVVIKPLVKHPDLVWYLILLNNTPPHNKVYLLTVIFVNGETKVIKQWGKWGYGLSTAVTDYDQKVIQKLVDDKAKKGYKIVDEDFIRQNDHDFEAYITELLEKIKELQTTKK